MIPVAKTSTAALCVTAKSGARLPEWVKGGIRPRSTALPLHPQQRTHVGHCGTSETCQQLLFAPRKTASLCVAQKTRSELQFARVTATQIVDMPSLRRHHCYGTDRSSHNKSRGTKSVVNHSITGAISATMVAFATGAVAAQDLPSITIASISNPVTFATHAELERYGFLWGPSDGQFGAIPTGGGHYTFYGAAASTFSCAGTPKANNSAFSFTGTLDHVTGSNGCQRLFGPGTGPAGWVFDKNYAGGGQVVRIALGDKRGWLMSFHGEVWWQNPASPDRKCQISVGSASTVPCFYSSLGLAVSTDGGKTFRIAGQALQPSQPMSIFTGSGTIMAVGYGSLIVADANGKHLDNPPADASSAYFYLFYTDLLPGLPGACAKYICLGVARARYNDVIMAVLSGDPHRVATVFHKYDGASPDPWTQPATSDTPDQSGTAGKYAPLWIDEPAASAAVIYDKSFDVYLAAYRTLAGLKLRASNDLIHWTRPIGSAIQEPGRELFYPTPVGETGDPIIAGPAPRLYFSSFPTGLFPNWKTSAFESVQITLSHGNVSP